MTITLKGNIMSEKSKNKMTTEEVVLDADNNGGEEVEQEKLFWDDLMIARMESVKALLGQQTLLVELARNYTDVLDKNKNLNATVTGLNNSYKDIGSELRETMNKHITFIDDKIVDNKKGEVIGDDAYYDYIQIGGEYIASQEKIANLASTAYLDIFTQLKVDAAQLAGLKNLKAEGQKIIKDAIKDAQGNTNAQ